MSVVDAAADTTADTSLSTLPTTVVVPTVGRPSLAQLLAALADATGPPPLEVIVVDDRRVADRPEMQPLETSAAGYLPVQVVRGGGRGPAHARNVGWRQARTPWVSFLDDDVVPDADWLDRLADDLAASDPGTAGIQGSVRVPLPDDRRPTDWERVTAGLTDASWITADMTYRRDALVATGGFDERFPRAFREDADIALRVQDSCGRLVRGRRGVRHPVRPVDDWVSVRAQAGNADDVLMRRLHGRGWYARAAAARGRRPMHVAVTAAAVAAALAAVSGRRRAAGLAGAVWLGGSGVFAWQRIAPGPRTATEVRRMLLTSAAIPFAAVWHTLRGWWEHRGAVPWQGLPDLVVVSCDLVLDHNAESRPAARTGAREQLDRLRSEGVRIRLSHPHAAADKPEDEPADEPGDDTAAEDDAALEAVLGPLDQPNGVQSQAFVERCLELPATTALGDLADTVLAGSR